MKTKRIIKLSLISIVSVFLIAHAQINDTAYEDSLCEYTWNSDINDCPDVLDCIYPLQWNDTTIKVHRNISHISRDDIKLCLEDITLEDFFLKDITVANLNTGSSASAIISQWDLVFDTVWAGPMSKTVGLKPDLNEIQLNLTFQKTDSTVDTTLWVRFFMDVGAENDYTSECYYCWYRTQLKTLVYNTPIDTLTWENTVCDIRVEYYGPDTLDQIDVVVKSTNSTSLSKKLTVQWTQHCGLDSSWMLVLRMITRQSATIAGTEPSSKPSYITPRSIHLPGRTQYVTSGLNTMGLTPWTR